MDAKRPDRLDDTAIAERRKTVASLYLNRVPMRQIAHHLKVSPATVCVDLKALRAEWREEHLADIEGVVVRELAELDAMEQRCVLMDAKSKTPEWMDRRLRVKERRARLLGLDAPAKQDITSGGQVLGQWSEVREVVMSALAAFPEARQAISAALILEESDDPE